jgi:hypothetical protein
MPLLPGISNKGRNTEKLATMQFWSRRHLKVFFLNKVQERYIFNNVTDLLSSDCEVTTVEPEERFDEDTYSRGYLSPEGSECFKFIPLSKEWSEVCAHLNENNVEEADKLLL